MNIDVMKAWRGQCYICEHQGFTRDYSTREIKLEPRAEGDNEPLFASSTVFPIHH